MANAKFASNVAAVRLSHARLARIFSRIALGAAVGPVALALLASVLGTIGVHFLARISIEAWLLGWLLGTPLATLVALVAGMRRLERAVRVEVDDDALHLDAADQRRTIPRHQLAGALHVASRLHTAEIVLTSGDVLHVELERPDDARALVVALGFGTSDRRTVVPLGSAHDTLAAGCWSVVLAVCVTILSSCGLAAAASNLLNAAGGYILGVIFVGTSLLFARIFTPKRVIVGTDGVLLGRSFGERFVPLASISGVDVTRRGLVLVLDGGKAQREIVLTNDKGQIAYALRERIAEAVAMARGAGAETASALVARGGRSLAEWREALRKLVAGGGYRGERVSLDALLRAAESAETPAEQRLGAAMAIGLAEDAGAKQRLRIAVEGIANERMRIAMEAAAEGEAEDAMIAEALAAEKRAAERK
jgi:hypothetical protein